MDASSGRHPRTAGLCRDVLTTRGAGLGTAGSCFIRALTLRQRCGAAGPDPGPLHPGIHEAASGQGLNTSTSATCYRDLYTQSNHVLDSKQRATRMVYSQPPELHWHLAGSTRFAGVSMQCATMRATASGPAAGAPSMSRW